MNCMVKGKYLCLPIGTKFSFKQKGFVNKQINLINNKNKNEFFAIFDENDVDFEIWCDNRECDRGIGVDFLINQKIEKFYIAPKSLNIFKALETNGRKLHFISQNSNDARVLVAQTANKYGISYELAEIKCSRIEFAIHVEECKNNVYVSPFNSVKVTLIGTKIQLSVKTLTGKTITIEIGLNNTFNDLKMIIAKKDGIPPNIQRLIFAGKQLEDDKNLEDYDILNGSTVHLYKVLSGGGPGPPPFTQFTDSHKNSKKELRSKASQLFSLERGVICYGEPSNEKFKNYYGFKRDFLITVNSFAVEMRIKSRMAPI